jgi:hypothetical protein
LCWCQRHAVVARNLFLANETKGCHLSKVKLWALIESCFF